ncbi:MAG: glycosyltransferase, partial [Fervidobacterium sp.]
KDVNFYIIGPLDRNFNKDKYSQTNNMIFTGTQPYEIIPTILSKVDISIMPFRKNQLVKTVNPVKIYESLAMGKPVIATRYEETEKFGDLIFTYDSAEEFESILSKLLSQNEEETVIRRRIEFARENSWEKRVGQIEKLWENL